MPSTALDFLAPLTRIHPGDCVSGVVAMDGADKVAAACASGWSRGSSSIPLIGSAHFSRQAHDSDMLQVRTPRAFTGDTRMGLAKTHADMSRARSAPTRLAATQAVQ